ncbi:lipopolysaccharide biosynthesis protein [Parerythrobacter jejuensis]|uniref:Oligosaccharide flippase family protein n=1 Tax=Parerythrobacter jejuensis TaxID=795812 RepID=A0A845AIB0_9SPHN|nr:lipopolysaccharide biosynthesis protein [Parerythrobacter jejuensis]MXP30392.1 oligosaccharide flippase family protein [Parerythrobacter jejuensis]MXP33152.1 oligosaccharide flippase family protein [Parerythrobacter jejuensis]
MRRIFRNMGWLLGGRGFNAVLSLVYLALATRTLGLDGFGYFAIIVALGQTVTGLVNFQTWQFVVRWGAGEDGAARAAGFAVGLDIISAIVGTLISAILVATAQLWLPLPDELLWVAFGYCIVSLLSIRSTPTGLLRLRFEYARATAAEAVQPAIRAIGAGLAVVFMPTVAGFILAWAAAEVAVAAALWFAALQKERLDLREVSLTAIPRAHPGAWRFVLSTNALGSLQVAGKQVMILLVGAVGGEAFAGGFRVASQLGQALVQLAQTVSKAIFPELVHAKERAADIARRMANMALVGGALAVLVALFAGREALVLIAGQEFRVVYWAMVILAIGGAVELVGASLESLLVSAGRAGTAFLVRAVPMAIAFACLDVAMGWQGLKGAALCMLGASSLAVIGYWVAILSQQGIRIELDNEEEEAEKRPAE